MKAIRFALCAGAAFTAAAGGLSVLADQRGFTAVIEGEFTDHWRKIL
jgi:hypothetical protein